MHVRTFAATVQGRQPAHSATVRALGRPRCTAKGEQAHAQQPGCRSAMMKVALSIFVASRKSSLGLVD